jgi:hypothetical protein
MTEEQHFEQEFEILTEIAYQNGLETHWSVDTISPLGSLSLKWPVKAKFMTDGVRNDIKVELPDEHLTGLELWKYADKLYKLIGDEEHRFVEEFKLNGNTIEVFFGS